MSQALPQDDLRPTIAYLPVAGDSATVDPCSDATVEARSTGNSIPPQPLGSMLLGPYRLKGKLGSGGMGEVYAAEHLLLRRPCAIKLIKLGGRADRRALDRFEQEVRAAAKLTHWNTVQIYDYGHTEEGIFYCVMELLPGLNLDDLVSRHGPLSPERVVHLLSQTCNALREAHGMGLVHRDIKPANIFAARRGGVYDVAKLLDFGLVRQQARCERSGPQAPGQQGFSGSPLYMAPEQAAAFDDADPRSDVYSLGAVAYYLLTGSPPFTGRSAAEVVAAHAGAEVMAPSSLRDDTPLDLEKAVLRCLRKDPNDRFPSAGTLRQALQACRCAGKWTEQRAASWWHGVEGPCSRDDP